MTRLFDPNALARTYRDPVAIAILLVDLFPIYAVIALQWNATALVFLYWLENLVIGGFALARMTAASVKDGLAGGVAMAFVGPFFIVHFGMFCFVHGIFLSGYAATQTGGENAGVFPSPLQLIETALQSGAYLEVFLLAIIAVQAYLFVRDFILRGEYKDTSIDKQMSAPYGRIVVLHVALFIGMAAMIGLGQPMIGVLFLILLRSIWGVLFTVKRHLKLEADGG